MATKYPTPYQRIVRAANRGGGCYLTPEDCFNLGKLDDAVFSRAQFDDEEQAEARKAARRAKRKPPAP